MKRIVVALAMALASSSVSVSAQTNDEAARGKALAAAMSEYLLAFYTCHRYTGIEQYIAARSIATNLSERISGDRNSAVLNIDMLDRKVRSMKPDGRLEAQFEEDGTPRAARADFCYEITEEARTKFEVEQAKSRLL